MRIGFTTIKVKDMEESEHFYQDILELEKTLSFSPQDGVRITFLQDEEGNKIELIDDETVTDLFENKGSLVSLGIEVNELDDIIKMLEEKNIEIIKGPVKVPSGARFVFIEDPNGVEIEFIEGFNVHQSIFE
ncbi:MAG: VOC family protein [Bacteroidales bacterium]